MKINESFFFEREHDNFLNSKVYKKLKKDFQHLFLDFLDDTSGISYEPHTQSTIFRSPQIEKSVMHYAPFIYLNKLIDKHPRKIADIGCGYNFIKKYFSNVIGYDETKSADVKEYFDKEFITKYHNEFDYAIAINSLHLLSIDQFSNRINEFSKIIKPGGYGFITFNLQRMIEKTNFNILKNLNTSDDFFNYFNNEIKMVDQKIIVFDNLIKYYCEKTQKTKQQKYEIFKGSDWPDWENFQKQNYKNLTVDIQNELNEFKNNYINQYNKAMYSEGSCGNIRIIFEKQ